VAEKLDKIFTRQGYKKKEENIAIYRKENIS